ncbi:MAG: 6-carboxytetrahydropterin synthase QueD [Planctomycetes bacterium]|nr:6-carboxytetrahydropterin synthase QueD [Planctomycetota bacterium]
MKVTKEFVFDAAHYLPNYEGKCERLHGHTWKLHVTVNAPVETGSGLAFDFVQLKNLAMERVVNRLDHQVVNDVVSNPSAEMIALWVWHQLRDLPLFEIKVWETPTSFATCASADYAAYAPQTAPAEVKTREEHIRAGRE